MQKFDRRAGDENSKLDIVIRLVGDCSVASGFHFRPVLGMNTLQKFFPGRHTMFRIKAVYAIPFLGEIQRPPPASSQIKAPGPCTSLPQNQVAMPSAKRLLSSLLLADIADKSGEDRVPAPGQFS